MRFPHLAFRQGKSRFYIFLYDFIQYPGRSCRISSYTMRKTHPNHLLLLLFVIPFLSFQRSPAVSPLAAYSAEWNKPMYNACNTAAKSAFLTPAEKDVIYVLNLARMYPSLFLETVIKQYPEKSDSRELINSSYYKSLVDTFKTLKAGNLLLPDLACFTSAKCHAVQAGKDGYVGHDRSKACERVSNFSGECCDYGNNEALDIVMHLLIDEDVPSLGHREICLDSYKKLGISIQPHKMYSYNAVLDFK